MFTLIENGDIYTPGPVGKGSILSAGGRIARVGAVDAQKLAAAGIECDILDASGCVVVPGFIDPHSHIIGAGGEQGYATRTPEVQISEIALAGVTTVVGCLGTDGTNRHLTTLLAKARGLDLEGVTTYIYTGNFQVPPPTITGSVLGDITIIDKVIGVGEIAISDSRSSQPAVQELARIASEAVIGSLLSGKAGVVHFHTGPSEGYLGILKELLNSHEIPPKHIHATHINRTEALLDDAVALAKMGAFVDMDTVDEDLGRWIKLYLDHGGPPEQLTISSDAHAQTSTRKMQSDVAHAVLSDGVPLERALPFLTTNTARVLRLDDRKGRLQEGFDADLLVMDRATFAVKHVVARGKVLVRDGEAQVHSKWEKLLLG